MSNGNRIGLATMLLSIWLVAAAKTLQNFGGLVLLLAMAIGFVMLLIPEDEGSKP